MSSLTHSHPEDVTASPWNKFVRVAREETSGVGVRAWLAGWLPACLPSGAAGRLRAALYRRLGVSVGPGALIMGPLTLAGGADFHKHVRIGAGCYVNRSVYLDTTAPITLGAGVSVGHHVVIVTAGHAIGPPEFRAGAVRAAPVTVEDGAWLGAGVTLLPGVTVGRGAVVAAGAVVARDVPPDTLAGGVPAKQIRLLETGRAA